MQQRHLTNQRAGPVQPCTVAARASRSQRPSLATRGTADVASDYFRDAGTAGPADSLGDIPGLPGRDAHLARCETDVVYGVETCIRVGACKPLTELRGRRTMLVVAVAVG